MQNTVALTGTATDTGSGIASLRFQYAPAGTGTWTDICTDTELAVHLLVQHDRRGRRALRHARARHRQRRQHDRLDRADQPPHRQQRPGRRAHEPVAGRVRGTINVARHGDRRRRRHLRRPSSTGRAPAPGRRSAVDTTPPYSCTADSTPSPDGTYERAHDGDRHARPHVDLAPRHRHRRQHRADGDRRAGLPTAATSGRIDAGDTVTFTWSEPMAPASILAGWSGASQAIRVRVTDAGAADTLDLYNAAGATRLNVMSADAGAAPAGRLWCRPPPTFNATMRHDGQHASTVTIGSLITRHDPHERQHDRDMIWTPSTAATDAGRQPRDRDGGHRDRRQRPRLLAPPRRGWTRLGSSGTVARGRDRNQGGLHDRGVHRVGGGHRARRRRDRGRRGDPDHDRRARAADRQAGRDRRGGGRGRARADRRARRRRRGSTTRACGSCTPPARCGRWRSASDRRRLLHDRAADRGRRRARRRDPDPAAAEEPREDPDVRRRPARDRRQGRREHGEHPAARGDRAGAGADRRRGRRPGRLHERAHRRLREGSEHGPAERPPRRRRHRRARPRADRDPPPPGEDQRRPRDPRLRPGRASRPSTCARSRARSRRSTRSSTSSSARCPEIARKAAIVAERRPR